MERKELPKIDLTEFVGIKTTTESAEVIGTKYGLALIIKTKFLDDNDMIRASNIYNFSEEDGKYFIGADTKLDRFLTAKGVDYKDIPEDIEKGTILPMLEGLNVVVQMNSKSGYLEMI